MIADAYEGKRLNSPNDVVVKSDGSVWFSDPHYGIVTDYEGRRSNRRSPAGSIVSTPGPAPSGLSPTTSRSRTGSRSPRTVSSILPIPAGCIATT